MKNFDNLGVMLDCSRGGVAKISTLKKIVDLLSDMGYNFLQLYTEDIFEVIDNPYFGYMRGKYTKEEIQDLDRYAKSKGIELMPCIQTLAHMTHIFRWEQYYDINDCDDILLIDEEKTYNFIDKIFASLAEYYTSRNIHIGMDEAGRVGLGKYLAKHGYTERFGLFCRHLQKVVAIAKKYGFKPMMWSDMFFNLMDKDENGKIRASDKILSQVPKEVGLVCWDYYKTDKEYYKEKFEEHRIFKNDLYFAAGAISWTGYCPANELSIKATAASMKACIESNVRNAFITLWGDNGKECSFFALLPTLFAFSEYAKGNFDLESIKEKFFTAYGISFDNFCELDDPNKVGNKPAIYNNPNKYLFFNDVFMGIMDQYAVEDGIEKKFIGYAKALEKHIGNKSFGYVFDCIEAQCRVLSIKSNLGIKTRKAYGNRDISTLRALADNEYVKLQAELENFYKKFKTLWFLENKPFGFEVHDMRLGGLIRRIKSCRERLIDYCENRIDNIPELEEKILDFLGGNEKFDYDQTMSTSWYSILTTNNV